MELSKKKNDRKVFGHFESLDFKIIWFLGMEFSGISRNIWFWVVVFGASSFEYLSARVEWCTIVVYINIDNTLINILELKPISWFIETSSVEHVWTILMRAVLDRRLLFTNRNGASTQINRRRFTLMLSHNFLILKNEFIWMWYWLKQDTSRMWMVRWRIDITLRLRPFFIQTQYRTIYLL